VRVAVALTPRDVRTPPPGAAVAIDVLRATSTLAVALSNGATHVRPVATPAEAMAEKRRRPDALLCGERDGRRIAGFDLGNSPFEYPPEVVRGRELIFASTNGSQAMIAAAGARRRRIGAFVNAAATLAALEREPDVLLVCAGKLGRFSLEDAAFAGWLGAALESRGATLEGEAARLARSLAPATADEVHALVQGASHARYLRRMGAEFAKDVEFCARLDTIDRAFEL
jgi:2-phosphosulfolactate phosphatase